MSTTTQTGRFLSKLEVDTIFGFAGEGARKVIREDISFHEQIARQICAGIQGARDIKNRARETELEGELRACERLLADLRKDLREVK